MMGSDNLKVIEQVQYPGIELQKIRSKHGTAKSKALKTKRQNKYKKYLSVMICFVIALLAVIILFCLQNF